MWETKKILVTGGAGFIGSHVVRRLVKKYPHYTIWNLDKLTYAGNLENLVDIERAPNYRFIKADIANHKAIAHLFAQEDFDGVIHLAAASHVDRSLTEPHEFIHTNITGTVNLLQAAVQTWKNKPEKRFYHISTDEVYGALSHTGIFTESTPLNPQSPYSASKAGSDHFVHAFHNSYGLPMIISRCTNNYGPCQFPEKLIPLTLKNIINNSPIPIYGHGQHVRDWLYVTDHAQAIDIIFHRGKTGHVYNIGSNNEQRNIDLIKCLCTIMDQKLDRKQGRSEQLITFVKDRSGHDFRYAVDPAKLKTELSWMPTTSLEQGLHKTIDWYLNHPEWLENIASGAYRTYYEHRYTNV